MKQGALARCARVMSYDEADQWVLGVIFEAHFYPEQERSCMHISSQRTGENGSRESFEYVFECRQERIDANDAGFQKALAQNIGALRIGDEMSGVKMAMEVFGASRDEVCAVLQDLAPQSDEGDRVEDHSRKISLRLRCKERDLTVFTFLPSLNSPGRLSLYDRHGGSKFAVLT
ncbi:hypothetical protein FVE85_7012 [Porphyridium purpureum]|uniref:Uncharacterized protein n=1 Tax=Porphyridium purpureum TaxID=35688 RepID=A0A5J4Z9W1_PORPP|nr:hypothetical protein FVE85_7012 [Porphyridium purpureum]|eukprot:POR6835..scf295_1